MPQIHELALSEACDLAGVKETLTYVQNWAEREAERIAEGTDSAHNATELLRLSAGIAQVLGKSSHTGKYFMGTVDEGAKLIT